MILRNVADTERASQGLVSIGILGYNETDLAMKKTFSEMEAQFPITFIIRWVLVPTSIVFMGTGISFDLIVDPANLESSHAYFAEVAA